MLEAELQELYNSARADEDLQKRLDTGKPRPGHPEGTIRAHVREVEENIEKMRDLLTDEEYWKLRVVALTHDSFKSQESRGKMISDPASHASRAKQFMKHKFNVLPWPPGGEAHKVRTAILKTIQWHDEPYALYRKAKKGKPDERRTRDMQYKIDDWDLFLAFQLADNLTAGKTTRPDNEDPTRWFFDQMKGKVETKVDETWMERFKR